VARLAQTDATRFGAYIDEMITNGALPHGLQVINAVVVLEGAYYDADGMLHTQPIVLCPMGDVSRIWLRGLFSRIRKRVLG
jgi:hypothetical protein